MMNKIKQHTSTTAVVKTDNREANITSLLIPLLDKIGGITDIVQPGMKVLIKPNFVAPFPKAVTSLDLVEEVVKLVLSLGAFPLVAESSGYEFDTAVTFSLLGVDKMLSRYGLKMINIDQEEFDIIESNYQRVPKFKISRLYTTSDVLISLPRLKGHGLTKVTFGIKNSFGLIHRETRSKIHATGLERGIFELSRIIGARLVIIDGMWTLNKAVFSEAEFNGVLIASKDFIEADYAACLMYGINPNEVGHIRLAGENKVFVHQICYMNAMAQDQVEFLRGRYLTFKKRVSFYIPNFAYKVAYVVERISQRVFRRSIIPDFHLYFGIRPYIVRSKCVDCGECVRICPINCISRDVRIDYKRCKYVRCMKCVEACRYGAIRKKGWHRG